jgi:hypothetical protein
VDLVLYPGPEGEVADLMRQLLQEMEEVVPRLHLVETQDAPELEPGHGSGMPIEGPILTLRPTGGNAYGARFLGMTAGLEFGTLVETIKNVSHGQTGLSAETLQALEGLGHPVHIQVFTTPT